MEEKVVLYTTCINSTPNIQKEQRNLRTILDGFKIKFTEVDLNQYPDRKQQMVNVSKNVQLPQLHVNNVNLGKFSDIQDLIDEGEFTKTINKLLEQKEAQVSHEELPQEDLEIINNKQPFEETPGAGSGSLDPQKSSDQNPGLKHDPSIENKVKDSIKALNQMFQQEKETKRSFKSNRQFSRKTSFTPGRINSGESDGKQLNKSLSINPSTSSRELENKFFKNLQKSGSQSTELKDSKESSQNPTKKLSEIKSISSDESKGKISGKPIENQGSKKFNQSLNSNVQGQSPKLSTENKQQVTSQLQSKESDIDHKQNNQVQKPESISDAKSKLSESAPAEQQSKQPESVSDKNSLDQKSALATQNKIEDARSHGEEKQSGQLQQSMIPEQKDQEQMNDASAEKVQTEGTLQEQSSDQKQIQQEEEQVPLSVSEDISSDNEQRSLEENQEQQKSFQTTNQNDENVMPTSSFANETKQTGQIENGNSEKQISVPKQDEQGDMAKLNTQQTIQENQESRGDEKSQQLEQNTKQEETPKQSFENLDETKGKETGYSHKEKVGIQDQPQSSDSQNQKPDKKVQDTSAGPSEAKHEDNSRQSSGKIEDSNVRSSTESQVKSPGRGLAKYIQGQEFKPIRLSLDEQEEMQKLRIKVSEQVGTPNSEAASTDSKSRIKKPLKYRYINSPEYQSSDVYQQPGKMGKNFAPNVINEERKAGDRRSQQGTRPSVDGVRGLFKITNYEKEKQSKAENDTKIKKQRQNSDKSNLVKIGGAVVGVVTLITVGFVVKGGKRQKQQKPQVNQQRSADQLYNLMRG